MSIPKRDSEIHVFYKGEPATACHLGNNKWKVHTQGGKHTVDGSHPDLGLTGPAVTDREQLDELYADIAQWADADDMCFRDYLEHDDDCCSIPIERCVRCQDSWHQWYIEQYGEVA